MSLQMLYEMGEGARINLLQGCLNLCRQDSKEVNNYAFMMHTTSFLMLNSMYNDEIVMQSASELRLLNEYLVCVQECLFNTDSDFIGQCQSCDSLNTQIAKLITCSMLLWLYLHQCDPTPDLMEFLDSGFLIQKPPDVILDMLYKFEGTKGSSYYDMETILSALSSNPTSSDKTLVNSKNAHRISSQITFNVLFQLMYTLSRHIKNIDLFISDSFNDIPIPNCGGMLNCKNIISNFCNIVSTDIDNYTSQSNKSDMEIVIVENSDKVNRLLAVLDDYCLQVNPEASLLPGEPAVVNMDLTSESALEKIRMRLPGYEGMDTIGQNQFLMSCL